MNPLLIKQAIADIASTWSGVALKNARTDEQKAQADRWIKEFDEKIREFDMSTTGKNLDRMKTVTGFVTEAARGLANLLPFVYSDESGETYFDKVPYRLKTK